MRLDPLPDGGTRLRLRESGFRTDDARRDNAERWLTELSQLAASVAVEPWQAGIHRVEHFASSQDRVWRSRTRCSGPSG